MRYVQDKPANLLQVEADFPLFIHVISRIRNSWTNIIICSLVASIACRELPIVFLTTIHLA